MPAPYGVVATGFNRKRLPEILESLNTGVKGVFGPDTNLAPQSPHGQFNGLMADIIHDQWELAEDVWHGIDPLQVTGTRLDTLLALFGLPPRRLAKYSGVTVDFVGGAGVTIPQGTGLASSSTSVIVFTDSPIVLDGGGLGSVIASPAAEGAISVVPNEIDIIQVAIANVTSVLNSLAATIGVLVLEAETDSEIRLRLLGRTGGIGVTNEQLRLENILRGLAGVIESVLYVNSTETVDERGIPGKTYALVIDGGDDITIANTLLLYHCAGIGTFGTTSIPIQDAQGICRKIDFSRPIDAIALLNITVRYVDSRCGCQPHDIDALKTFLINFLQDNREDCGGFGIGQPLIRSRLYAAFSNVPGLEIVSFTMAKHHHVFSFDDGCDDVAWDSGGFCVGQWEKEVVWTDDSIAIAWNEKPLFVEQGISLTVIDKFDNTISSSCEEVA